MQKSWRAPRSKEEEVLGIESINTVRQNVGRVVAVIVTTYKHIPSVSKGNQTLLFDDQFALKRSFLKHKKTLSANSLI